MSPGTARHPVPRTSILPRVDTSVMPTERRTGAGFVQHRFPPRCASTRAAAATAGGHERSAGSLVPLVQRQPALRSVVLTTSPPASAANGTGWRTDAAGLSTSESSHARALRQDGAPTSPRCGPVSRHAVGGEALHVLDVLVALAKAKPHVRAVTSFCRSTNALPGRTLPMSGDRRGVRIDRQIAPGPAALAGRPSLRRSRTPRSHRHAAAAARPGTPAPRPLPARWWLRDPVNAAERLPPGELRAELARQGGRREYPPDISRQSASRSRRRRPFHVHDPDGANPVAPRAPSTTAPPLHLEPSARTRSPRSELSRTSITPAHSIPAPVSGEHRLVGLVSVEKKCRAAPDGDTVAS